MYIMSTKKCKEIDQFTINNIGIPSIVLMENAANEVVNNISNFEGKFIIFCGSGNNGGDGLAIARKLILKNVDVHVVLVKAKTKCSEEFNINLKILKNLTSNIFYLESEEDIDNITPILKEYNIAIDCIFGIGLNRSLNNFYVKLIDSINKNIRTKIGIDVPSGLNADSGEVMGTAIEADITYTFEVIKRGFIEYKALKYLGDIRLLNIGIPEYVKNKYSESTFMLEKQEYSKLLNKRSLYGHKGMYGKVSILAGSKGYTGAAYITTEACIKSGAGLTTLISSSYVQDKLSCKLIEAMTLDIEDYQRVKSVLNNSDVVAIGPGIVEEKVYMDVFKNIDDYEKKLFVVDAGGLQLVSRDREIMDMIKGRAILTPHPGEMARLIGKSIEFVEENRIDVAKEYAIKNNIVLVLKGYKTVITDGYNVYINNTGNSKMASGGMGDCLTGIIASLLGQKHSLINAALLGTYIHGLSGDISSSEKYCTNASEVIENISKVMNCINS